MAAPNLRRRAVGLDDGGHAGPGAVGLGRVAGLEPGPRNQRVTALRAVPDEPVPTGGLRRAERLHTLGEFAPFL